MYDGFFFLSANNNFYHLHPWHQTKTSLKAKGKKKKKGQPHGHQALRTLHLADPSSLPGDISSQTLVNLAYVDEGAVNFVCLLCLGPFKLLILTSSSHSLKHSIIHFPVWSERSWPQSEISGHLSLRSNADVVYHDPLVINRFLWKCE